MIAPLTSASSTCQEKAYAAAATNELEGGLLKHEKAYAAAATNELEGGLLKHATCARDSSRAKEFMLRIRMTLLLAPSEMFLRGLLLTGTFEVNVPQNFCA
eukprot:gene20651-23457_t